MEKAGIKLSDHFDYGRLLKFTIPSILMMVISSVYSIVDGLFISNYAGSDAFAAVNLVMPVTMLLSCVGFMAGTGGSALISKTLGEGDKDGARKQFSLIIYCTIAFAVIMGIIVFIFVPLIPAVMGTDEIAINFLTRFAPFLTHIRP